MFVFLAFRDELGEDVGGKVSRAIYSSFSQEMTIAWNLQR
jgi:hypothetical protein